MLTHKYIRGCRRGGTRYIGGKMGLFLTNLLADLFGNLLVIRLKTVTSVHTLACTSGNRIVEGSESPKLDSFPNFGVFRKLVI